MEREKKGWEGGKAEEGEEVIPLVNAHGRGHEGAVLLAPCGRVAIGRRRSSSRAQCLCILIPTIPTIVSK